jgi:hypothetical protein
MYPVLLFASAILTLLLAAAGWCQYRRKLYAYAELGIIHSPIPAIELEQLDPIFAPAELGPGLQSEAYVLGGVVLGGTSEKESWILAALSKRASAMFEFGTATGLTAYLWAKNSAADARVVTLTLPSADSSTYAHGAGDVEAARDVALRESVGSTFYYTGTPVEAKITQLYGDSKELDSAAYAGHFDLIFIDGSHARSYVESDTGKALRMIRPGGLILWHDYMPYRDEVRGVFEFLNHLSGQLPLRRVPSTRLVCYRAPL